MNRENRIIGLFACLAFVIGLVLASCHCFDHCHATIHKHYGNAAANGNAQQDDGLRATLEIGDLIVQSIMAVGTILLFGIAVLSLRAANKTSADAIRASTKAVKQTRRSVDAYVNSERGRLTLMGAYRHVSNLPLMGFRFQNLGKTDMTIIGFDFDLQTVEKKSDTPRPPTFEHSSMERVMEPKGAFGSKFGTHPESGHKLIAIPDDILAELKAGRELVCSFGFLSSGPFGLYESCFTYFIPHGPDHTPLASFDEELRYDRPLTKKSS